jgi:hypothetical protein
MRVSWSWALIPLVIAVFAIQTCALVNRGNKVDDLRQTAEEAELRAEGLAVAQQQTERQLKDALDDADQLREQLAAAPRGSTPREVVKWRTKSVEIPVPSSPCDGSSSPPQDEPGSVLSPPTPAPFSVRLEGTQATLQTRKGSMFVVGSVDIVRVTPEPEELLARLPWETDATEFLVAAPAPRRRAGWGVGPAVGLVDGEWVYGAAATGPALGGRVALQPAAWALAGDGHWTGAGAVLVTW